MLQEGWRDRLRSWEGTAGDLEAALLAALAEEPWVQGEIDPSVRLIRHYTQLGVLDRPERRGKEAYYGFRQVAQFLAARWLLQDGWPLAKIAEETTSRSTEDLLSLLPGGPTNPALDLVRRFQQAGRVQSPPSPSPVREAQSWRAQNRANLQSALPALGNSTGQVREQERIELALSAWCAVLIDADRLAQLTDEEAALLGSTLTAALLSSPRRGRS